MTGRTEWFDLESTRIDYRRIRSCWLELCIGLSIQSSIHSGSASRSLFDSEHSLELKPNTSRLLGSISQIDSSASPAYLIDSGVFVKETYLQLIGSWESKQSSQCHDRQVARSRRPCLLSWASNWAKTNKLTDSSARSCLFIEIFITGFLYLSFKLTRRLWCLSRQLDRQIHFEIQHQCGWHRKAGKSRSFQFGSIGLRWNANVNMIACTSSFCLQERQAKPLQCTFFRHLVWCNWVFGAENIVSTCSRFHCCYVTANSSSSSSSRARLPSSSSMLAWFCPFSNESACDMNY